jgi:hypothetical protein
MSAPLPPAPQPVERVLGVPLRPNLAAVSRAGLFKDPTYGYTFRIWLPGPATKGGGEGWKPDPQSMEIVTQWHHKGSTYSMPLAIAIQNTDWYVVQRNWPGTDTTSTAVGAYQTDYWTRWEVWVKWSTRGDGALVIMKDGTVVLAETGQNAVAGPDGEYNYMKIGIYKWDWNETAPNYQPTKSVLDKRVLYHGEVTNVLFGPAR